MQSSEHIQALPFTINSYQCKFDQSWCDGDDRSRKLSGPRPSRKSRSPPLPATPETPGTVRSCRYPPTSTRSTAGAAARSPACGGPPPRTTQTSPSLTLSPTDPIYYHRYLLNIVEMTIIAMHCYHRVPTTNAGCLLFAPNILFLIHLSHIQNNHYTSFLPSQKIHLIVFIKANCPKIKCRRN